MGHQVSLGRIPATSLRGLAGDEEECAMSRAQDFICIEQGALSKQMHVYPRGVVIGCTYITRDAIREIWRRFQEQQ